LLFCSSASFSPCFAVSVASVVVDVAVASVVDVNHSLRFFFALALAHSPLWLSFLIMNNQKCSKPTAPTACAPSFSLERRKEGREKEGEGG